MNNIPSGATHYADFYGHRSYYKLSSHQYLNDVEEAWQTRYRYWIWEKDSWQCVGKGFSNRMLKEL